MRELLTVTLFLCVVIFSTSCFGSYTVEGKSMLPTLNDEDIVLTTADLTELHRGDIVLFYDPIKPDYIDICRIVGLPNETVEVHEGAVYIDGEYLVEPYVLPENNEKNRHSGKFVLAENTF